MMTCQSASLPIGILTVFYYVERYTLTNPAKWSYGKRTLNTYAIVETPDRIGSRTSDRGNVKTTYQLYQRQRLYAGKKTIANLLTSRR